MKKERERDQVVLSLQLSKEGQSTLQWAINRCQAGDTLTALHVVESLPGSLGPRPAERVGEAELDFYKEQIGNACCAFICVFKDLCELKKIEVVVRIAHGNDAKQVLAEEAMLLGATKLILEDPGRNAKSRMKYYIDHLSPKCAIHILKGAKLVACKPGKASKSTAIKGLGRAISRNATAQWNSERQANTLAKPKMLPPLPPRNPILPGLENCLSPRDSASSSEDSSGHSSPTSVLRGLRGSKSGSLMNLVKENSPPGNGGTTSDVERMRDLVAARSLSVAASRPQRRNSAGSGPLQSSQTVKFLRNSNSPSNNSDNSLWVGTVLDTDVSNAVESAAAAWPQFVSGLASVRLNEDGNSCDNVGGERPAGALALLSGAGNNAWMPFKLSQLEEATDGFREENVVGRGGCSRVYHGVLPDGRHVAVKRQTRDGSEATREFDTEVEVISTIRHRNVVELLGFCMDGEDHMLVYELMQQGNLDENLHDIQRPTLSWPVRQTVALDVAQGVDYLHSHAPRPVIHRDIKASNILLDGQGKAKISDFGLAKWNNTSADHITADVVGTFGYLAPEYFMYGKVNEKTDVYSYGVVLLELITGRCTIDVSRPRGEENLVLWAKPMLESGEFDALVDPRLNGEFSVQQMHCMGHVAKLCLRNNATRRPTMREVVRLLEDDLDSCLKTNSTSPSSALPSGDSSPATRQLGTSDDLYFGGADSCSETRRHFLEVAMEGHPEAAM